MGLGKDLRVVAAAIRDVDGEVFSVPPPGRHHNIIQLMCDKGRECSSLECQGFLLSDGSFAQRKPAKVVAINAGQLLPRASTLGELFSEDVW
jgi:hypothetical protein